MFYVIQLSLLPFAFSAAVIMRRSTGIPLGTHFTDSWISYYGDGVGGSDPAPIAPNYGACGFQSPTDPKYFGALYWALFQKYQESYPSSICGQCAKIECLPGSFCQGRSTIVEIVDTCPGCKQVPSNSSLDISHVAFGDLVGSFDKATQLGVMQVQWTVVSCPSKFGPIAGNALDSEKASEAPQQVTLVESNSTSESHTGSDSTPLEGEKYACTEGEFTCGVDHEDHDTVLVCKSNTYTIINTCNLPGFNQCSISNGIPLCLPGKKGMEKKPTAISDQSIKNGPHSIGDACTTDNYTCGQNTEFGYGVVLVCQSGIYTKLDECHKPGENACTIISNVPYCVKGKGYIQ